MDEAERESGRHEYRRTRKRQSDKSQGDGFAFPGLPRDWLTPYILLMLKEWHAHGYEMVQRLAQMGFAVDPSYLYRLLRHLEDQGILASTWQTLDRGPARRLYELTELGEQLLRTWADALALYRRNLDEFFRMYGLHGGDSEGEE